MRAAEAWEYFRFCTPRASHKVFSVVSGTSSSNPLSSSGESPANPLGPGRSDYLALVGNPTDQDFEQFCSVMERLNDVPVHVHCIANYRVSAFFYRYRRDVLRMDETQARGEMEAIWHPEGVWAAFVDC